MALHVWNQAPPLPSPAFAKSVVKVGLDELLGEGCVRVGWGGEGGLLALI